MDITFTINNATNDQATRLAEALEALCGLRPVEEVKSDKVCRDVKGPDEEKFAGRCDRLLAVVRKAPGKWIDRRKLYRNMNIRKSQIDDILETLQDRGQIGHGKRYLKSNRASHLVWAGKAPGTADVQPGMTPVPKKDI